MHTKTFELIEAAKSVLEKSYPMTLRQVFYQLVSRQALENRDSRYDALGRALVEARKAGMIPWEWIEDRLRQPRHISMWDSLADFADSAARSFRLDVWETQPIYIEAWLEKDALSGIFEAILDSFGVTLNVGRGYDGWSSIFGAAQRFGKGEGVTILYFGDFDPSGEDMVKSLKSRLRELGSEPEIIKCALTADDIERYNLPAAMTKKSDTRRARFIAEHGDRCVELDALPADVLRAQLKAEVEGRMDLMALAAVKKHEGVDRAKLKKRLEER